ncbi:MAG: sodium ABC transporter [Acidobacteria bacterium]|nr:MAG: sodium ABC transporter [Acidobacteriota bacterium]
MPSLAFRDVSKSYAGTLAVSHISLEVSAGEIFGLLGPNGAGKTTLIRMALDIIRPDSGEILVNSLRSTAADMNRIGYLPEERGLYRKQKVTDVLDYFGRLKGMPGGHVRQEVLAALERVGLADWASRKVEELSKGMQQKVQIVATLLHQPDVVILDEPFSGLDPVNVRMVKEMLSQLRERGCVVVLSTHQMEQVEEMCDRIAMIHQGRLVLYGRLEEIKRRFTAHLEPVTRIEVPTVSLEEIFVRVVERAEQEGEAALT